MKSYKEFEDLAERAFSPAGQAARKKMRQQGDFNAARKAYDAAKAKETKQLPAAKEPKLLPGGRKQSFRDYAKQRAGQYARKKGGQIARRAADKGGQIVRSRMQQMKDREAAKKVAKQRLASGPATTPAKMNADSVRRSNNSKASAEAKKRAMDKLKASTKKDTAPGGFMGGVKKSLGGDMFSKDPDKRREARYNRGKAMADGVKSKIGSLRKIRLQPPSTNTQIGDNQSVTGPKKFGKSAS